MPDTVQDTSKKRIVLPGEKPKWSAKELEELKKTSALIDTLLAHESRRAVAENEAEIKKFLREALLIRHFGQDDEVYYRYKLAEDVQLKTAINFLNNKNAYASLLKPRSPQGKEQGTAKTK
jgi:hypothetical protein